MRREFGVAMLAHRRGVPTARPVALVVRRALGPLVRGYLVTEELTDAENLLEVLRRAQGAGSPPEPARRRLAAAVGRAVAAMHRAGIVHADLNLKNLLVRNAFDRPEVFIVDFDKARLVDEVSAREQRANLARLDRSARKWPASRRMVGPLDRAAVLRAYRTARRQGEEG
jgi:3-deoxy-D-manno-octulosonic acid kinase